MHIRAAAADQAVEAEPRTTLRPTVRTSLGR